MFAGFALLHSIVFLCRGIHLVVAFSNNNHILYKQYPSEHPQKTNKISDHVYLVWGLCAFFGGSADFSRCFAVCSTDRVAAVSSFLHWQHLLSSVPFLCLLSNQSQAVLFMVMYLNLRCPSAKSPLSLYLSYRCLSSA